MKRTCMSKLIALAVLPVLISIAFSPRSASAAATASTDDAPAATVNGQVITGKDVEAAVDHIFREAALKHLVMKTLIDQEAKKAGVSVTDTDVDTALNEWKLAAFGGDDAHYAASLDEEGLTPKLYREVLRENILAQKIAAATTRLEDADFDQLDVVPILAHTREQAQQVYESLVATQRGQPGMPLDQLMAQGHFTVQWRKQTSVLRFDSRLDPGFMDGLFTLPIGSFAPPTASADGQGFEVLKIVGHRSGAKFATTDRVIWADTLLREKTRRHLQEWWVAMEKQVAQMMPK